MSCWAEVQQDDILLIAHHGRQTAKELREPPKETDDKGRVKWL